MISVRPAARGDLEALLDLWEALQADGAAADPRYQTAPDGRAVMRASYAELWLCRDPFPGAFVADDGAPCGFITGTLAPGNPVLVPRAAVRIDNLYVAPRARRRGVGRRLVDTFLAAAAAGGVAGGVDVGTLSRDARAVAFWTALGFQPMRVVLNREG